MILLIALLAVVPLCAFADITCPDSSKCPNNSTCCAWSSSGGFGCCPTLSGVCCKKDYCCDVGEVCENHFKKCINTLYSSKGPLAFTDSAKPKLRDVPCPAAGGSCPDNNTCCPTGCCPLPNAVCCNDGEHCCPANTVCDVSAGFCIGSRGQLFNLKSRSTGQVRETQVLKPASHTGVNVVYCPGGQYFCPDYNTCCVLASGQWGCCPLPSAVCCPDKVHCCPAGTHCGPTSTQCLNSESQEIPASKKFLARLLGNK